MNARGTDRSWPVWLWCIQWLPALGLIGFGATRVSDPLDLMVGSVLGIGIAWTVTITYVLLKHRDWIRARRHELLLGAASMAVALVLVDVAATLLGLIPTVESVRERSVTSTSSRYSSYRLLPKDILLDDGSILRINRRGFRGPEIQLPRPPGRELIIVLGGSQVFSFRGGDWPALAGEILRRRGHEVEVINAGVPGHSTVNSLEKLSTDLWTLDPSIVVVCQAWNDVKYFARTTAERPVCGLPPTQPRGWEKDWRQYPSGLDRLLCASSIYRKLRFRVMASLYGEEGFRLDEEPEFTSEAFSFGPVGPEQYELDLTLIAEVCARIDARLILCQQARRLRGTTASGEEAEDYALRNARISASELERALRLTDEIVTRVAARHEGIVVDMRRLDDESNFWDAVHFTSEGATAAAEVLAAALETVLDSHSPSP